MGSEMCIRDSFYPHDRAGGEKAAEVLGRMARRRPEHADAKMSVPHFIAQLRAIKRWGRALPDSLAHITQATLIVNGDEDLQVPTANSSVMHERIPGSALVIYPHAGHGSIFQYADDFAAEVDRFLR